MDRRDFLRRGSLFAGIAANLPPNRPEWMKHLGAGTSEISSRSAGENLKRKVTAVTNSNTPLQDLFGVVTPTDLIFERHHSGVPRIDPEAHRLLIHGLVERPLLFTMEEILRFPSVTRTHFLECSGNSQVRWRPVADERMTAQDIHGSISCCEWTGVPLSLLLAEAGAKPEAKWILAEGADAAAFSRSIPMEKALSDALVVYAQNGERLRPENGYPLRLVLPGFEGSMNVKWVRRLKLGDEPFDSREETSRYTDVMPDGKARKFTFVMEAKSVITSPSGGQKLAKKGFHSISGIAWSGRGKVKSVEVSVDSGKSWHQATLEGPVLPYSLTRFGFPWRWEGEATVVMSRTIDETGYVQPTRDELVRVRGIRSFYHCNAIQCWRVDGEGRVFHHEVSDA